MPTARPPFEPDDISRRRFVQATSATVLAASAPWLHAQDDAAGDAAPAVAALPTATLAGTDRVLPRLGLGCYPIAGLRDADEAIDVLRHALERGIRYLDTAPSYGRGSSESRIGRAIQGWDREQLFINTKTLERSADGARRELEESLRRLQTDYVDAIQVHAVHQDWESLFGDDAVLAGLSKARDEGLCRNIGITAHFNPKYLIESINRFDFDTALIPINPIDTKHMSFTRIGLPAARERGVGVIAMKIYAGGTLLREGRLSSGVCVRYALSQPGVDIIVPGCEKKSYIDKAWRAAIDFKPMTADEQRALEAEVGDHRGKDDEWYKDYRS